LFSRWKENEILIFHQERSGIGFQLLTFQSALDQHSLICDALPIPENSSWNLETFPSYPSLIVCGEGRQRISIWRRTNNSDNVAYSHGVDSIDPKGHLFKSAEISADGNFLYILYGNGVLEHWQVPSLFKVQSSMLYAEQFTLIENNSFRSIEPKRPAMLGILRRNDIQLVKTQEFEVIMSHPVPHNSQITTLMSTAWRGVDCKCRLPEKGASASDLPQSEPSPSELTFLIFKSASNIQICALLETFPLQHLESLMKADRWEEAIKCARNFKMDEQIVHEGRLKSLLDHPVTFNQCEEVLKNVDDTVLKVQFCIRAKCAQIEDVANLLKFGLAQVRILGEINDSSIALPTDQLSGVDNAPRSKVNNLHSQILDAMIRLGTWELLGSVYCVDTFRRFLTANLVDEAKKMAGQGRVRQLIVMCCRHDAVKANIVDIVSCLHVVVQVQEVLDWLKNSVLPICTPPHRFQINSWIERKAIDFECDPALGPRVALSFLELIFEDVKFCQSSFASFSNLFQQREIVQSDSAKKLLIELRDIVHLEENHAFIVSLSRYHEFSRQQIAIALLDRVEVPELLKEAVEMHFVPYSRRHQLDLESLLREYCEDILSDRLRFSSTWEERVLTLFQFISDVNNKCNLLIEIMARSPVPWSSALDASIMEILGRDSKEDSKLNPCIVPFRMLDLKEQFRAMELRSMLLNYHVSNCELSNCSSARQLIKYMATFPTLQALDDAITVADAYSNVSHQYVYRTFVKHHCVFMQLAQWKKCICALTSHPQKKSIATASLAIVPWMYQLFDNLKPDLDRKALLEKLLLLIDFVRDMVGKHVLIKERSRINAAYRLLIEFDYTATLKILQSPKGRLDLFLGIEKEKGSSRTLIKDGSLLPDLAKHETHGWQYIQRLADILEICSSKAQLLLIQKKLHEGAIDQALIVAMEWVQDAGNYNELFPIIQEFSIYLSEKQGQAANWNLIDSLVQFVRQCIAYVDDEHLPEALDYFKLLFLQQVVFKHCESGNYQRSLNLQSALREGVATQEKLQQLGSALHEDHSLTNCIFPWYYDSGYVMQTNKAMQILHQLIMTGLGSFSQMHPRSSSFDLIEKKQKNKAKARDPLREFEQQCVEILKILQNAKHYQISLSVCQLLCDFVMCQNLYNKKTYIDLLPITFIQAGIRECFSSLIQASCIDQTTAFGLLICLESKEAFQVLWYWMGKVGNNLDKVGKLCAVGAICGSFWQQRSITVECVEQLNKSSWWQQFKLLDIPYHSSDFNSKPERPVLLRKYLKPLLQNSSMDLVTGMEFAQQFHVDEDYVLLAYLQLQLYVGKEASLTENVSLLDYQSAILAVQDEIANKTLLLTLYKDSMLSCDPYDHIKLRFICDQICRVLAENSEYFRSGDLEIYEKQRLILSHIQGFEKPYFPCVEGELNVAERNGWNIELAKRKLNFRSLLTAGWEYISPFVNLSTVTYLVEVANEIAIPADPLYAQIVVQELKQRRHEKLHFSDFKAHIQKISAPDMAASMCIRISAKCNGIEKVHALRMALQLTEKWVMQQNQSSQLTKQGDHDHSNSSQLIEIKSRLAAAEVSSLLEQSGLHEYAGITNEPETLVRNLYMESSKLRTQNEPPMNIHLIADEIAAKSNVDLRKIRVDIIKVLSFRLLLQSFVLTSST
jgi:hypothetical protein